MAAPLLEASIEIEATPEQVWSVVSDLKRMGRWSPQCRKLIVCGGGPVALGTRTINVNKNKGRALIWLTTARVVRFEVDREIAYRIGVNNSIWGFTIVPIDGGVRLVERREAPNNTKKVSQVTISGVMGGEEAFDAEMVDGMQQTLAKIKAEILHNRNG